MGKLTTHVLDTAQGKPACGLRIELRRLAPMAETLVTTATNEDGRVTGALLEGAALSIGRYALTFGLGDYFREQGIALAEPAFLDEVVIQFGIAHPDQHYHVPLLASPWSYSTYRGS